MLNDENKLSIHQETLVIRLSSTLSVLTLSYLATIHQLRLDTNLNKIISTKKKFCSTFLDCLYNREEEEERNRKQFESGN